MSMREQLGRNLQRARKSRSLTQAALAEAVDKSVETISNMERGRLAPSLETLVDLARVLGVAPGALLQGIGGEGVAEAPPKEDQAATALGAIATTLDSEAVDQLLGIARLLARRSPRRRND